MLSSTPEHQLFLSKHFLEFVTAGLSLKDLQGNAVPARTVVSVHSGDMAFSHEASPQITLTSLVTPWYSLTSAGGSRPLGILAIPSSCPDCASLLTEAAQALPSLRSLPNLVLQTPTLGRHSDFAGRLKPSKFF